MSQRPINPYYQLALDIKNGKANGQYIYLMNDNKFYHYTNGYWEALMETDFLGQIEENMPELLTLPISVRNQVAENFKRIARKNLSIFNTKEVMNLINGMINPYTGELKAHTSEDYSTIRMPYEYIKEATCPLWLKTLDEILESKTDKLSLLQEFFGYCLTRETKYHKALLLLGESRSGKSTILQTLRNVIGINNCSSVPLKYIDNPQYTTRLINKLVNIDTDVSAKAAEFEAEFKTITSGEPIQAKILYEDGFDFVPYCKMVMAANIFPRITDHSSAFYNRLMLIPCDRVFLPSEQNRDLPKQLLDELPGILNWCIEGLQRLNNRGHFEEFNFMKDAVEELENENNPVNLFFMEHIEISFGAFIEKGELYEKYKNWCEKTRNFTLSKERFASCVFRKYSKETPRQARSSDGTRPYIWKNITYVQFKIEKEDINWHEPSGDSIPQIAKPASNVESVSGSEIKWED